MTKRVVYEWDIETLDEYGDVIDHSFSGEEFPGLPESKNDHLVLIRTLYAPDRICEESRGYAYVKDGYLPDWFDDGYNVPVRFKKKFDAARANE